MIIILQSLWNQSLTDLLVDGAKQVLSTHHHSFKVVQVPGAWELPIVAQWTWQQAEAESRPLLGIVACAVIIKGETHHFDMIAQATAYGLTNFSLEKNCAVTNAILAVYTPEQARERLGGKMGHKGEEAAKALLHLLQLKRT